MADNILSDAIAQLRKEQAQQGKREQEERDASAALVALLKTSVENDAECTKAVLVREAGGVITLAKRTDPENPFLQVAPSTGGLVEFKRLPARMSPPNLPISVDDRNEAAKLLAQFLRQAGVI